MFNINGIYIAALKKASKIKSKGGYYGRPYNIGNATTKSRA